VPAHRAAYEIAFGPIPHGKHVLQTCNNPPCCEPSHLYLGTPQESMQQAIARGTVLKKNKLTPEQLEHYAKKLTAAKVREICMAYTAGEIALDIAKRFGIQQGTVSSIVAGKTWAHTTAELGIKPRRTGPAATYESPVVRKRAAARRRRALKHGAIGSHTEAEWRAIVKCQRGVCAHYGTRFASLTCKSAVGRKARLTRDHIVPLDGGGSEYAFNIQGLCLSCNTAKCDRILDYAHPSLFDREGDLMAGYESRHSEISEADLPMITTAYLSGQTHAQIARRYRVGDSTIARILRRLGVPMRKPGPVRKVA
jgi:5-methylcytosine-specific restriction endonuclease McrA